MLVVKIETKTQNFFYILQLKMNIQLHLWGRSLACLSTRSPSPHGPNSKHLDQISSGRLSCASSCTWFNSWLILDHSDHVLKCPFDLARAHPGLRERKFMDNWIAQLGRSSRILDGGRETLWGHKNWLNPESSL